MTTQGDSNDGQRLLKETGESLRTIGDRVNVSQETARRWRSGVKLPSDEKRTALKEAYGIPVGSWDVKPGTELEAHTETVPTASAPIEVVRVDPGDVVGVIKSQIDRYHRMLEAGPEMSPDMRLKCEGQLRTAVGQLSRILEPDEKRILQMPAFQRVVRRMVDAVRDIPGALDAIVDAMKPDENNAVVKRGRR